MQVTETHPLPKKTFEKLANQRAMNCISIYLPMDKKGKEQNKHLAQAHLKTCINEVHKLLAQHQMHEDEITTFLKPLEQLLSKVELWRNPSDGLAIFLNPKEGMTTYQVPIPFELQTYVANHYYLKPLLPLYQNDGYYYLLELSQDYVKLFEASRFSFKDVYVEDFAPDRLEEAVGFDFRPKMLQFRSGQNLHGAGSFHGHGEGKDDDKKELTTFFRAVDKGVKKTITNQNAPLVLACVDNLYNMYKKVSTYSKLHNKNIGGEPDFKNKKDLHQESWTLIKGYFEKTKKRKLEQFVELYHTQKTSYQVDAIISAALGGKINTLFIKKGADVYGLYDKENRKVMMEDRRMPHNISLTNKAALETFLQGGEVYLLDSDEMPIKESSLNAIFRY